MNFNQLLLWKTKPLQVFLSCFVVKYSRLHKTSEPRGGSAVDSSTSCSSDTNRVLRKLLVFKARRRHDGSFAEHLGTNRRRQLSFVSLHAAAEMSPWRSSVLPPAEHDGLLQLFVSDSLKSPQTLRLSVSSGRSQQVWCATCRGV